jgi:hypothetical protein
MHKLAAYFMGEDGQPVVDRTTAAIREMNGMPVLGLDAPGGIIRQVGSPGDRVLEIVGSTDDIDRYVEVIAVKGWDLKNYRANPVFLFGHDYRSPAVGRAMKVWKEPGDGTPGTGKLIFHIKFAQAEEYAWADTIYKLYVGQYMRATSVGFLPWDWEDVEQPSEGKGTKSLEAICADITRKYGLNLAKVKGGKGKPDAPRRIFTKQDLLELSAVPVPANPNALVNAFQKGMLRDADMNRFRELGAVMEREMIDLSFRQDKRDPQHVIEVEELDMSEQLAPADSRPADATGTSQTISTAEPVGTVGKVAATEDGQEATVASAPTPETVTEEAAADSPTPAAMPAEPEAAVAAVPVPPVAPESAKVLCGQCAADIVGVAFKSKDGVLILCAACNEAERTEVPQPKKIGMVVLAGDHLFSTPLAEINPSVLAGALKGAGVELEVIEADMDSSLAGRVLQSAQRIAIQRVIKTLSAERVAYIRANTPVNEYPDLSRWGDLALAFLKAVGGPYCSNIIALFVNGTSTETPAPPAAPTALVVTPSAPSAVPESTNSHEAHGPPELEIIEVLHTPEDDPDADVVYELEATPAPAAAADMPPTDDVIFELAVNPNPTPAPAALAADSPVIELDPTALKDALGAALDRTLGRLTGDARYVVSRTKHLERR